MLENVAIIEWEMIFQFLASVIGLGVFGIVLLELHR